MQGRERQTHREMGAQSHGSASVASAASETSADRQTAERFIFRRFYVNGQFSCNQLANAQNNNLKQKGGDEQTLCKDMVWISIKKQL